MNRSFCGVSLFRSSSRFVTYCVVAALTCASSARAQTFVFGKASLGVSSNATSVAQGDFNGDGVLDFAVSNSSANTVSIILSKPNGAYAAKTDYTVTTPGQIVVGDFNEDGKLDLAVAAGTAFDVLLGNGDGTFQTPQSSAVPATSVAVADFNHDGKLDLFIAGSTSAAYLGNGDGTFTLSASSLGSYSYVSVADFNGDGKPDVMLTTASGGEAYLGNGSGGFTAAGAITLGGGPSAIGDFNGDGKLDVAVSYTSCSTHGGCHSNLDIWSGVGDGTFTFASSAVLIASATSLLAADFNQDGKVDLLATPTGLLFGNGDGTFQPYTTSPIGISPVHTVIGDYNNDGQLDIAALDKNGFLSLAAGNHGTFAGATATTVKAVLGSDIHFVDINGDGKLDELSYGVYPSQGLVVQLGNGDGTFQAPQVSAGNAMSGGIAIGDFNNDGKLDVAVGNGTNGSSLTYSVYPGNGDGTFGTPVNTYSNRYGMQVTAGDVNGDGKLDLLAIAQNGGVGVDVSIGNGDGSFQPAVTYATCSPGFFYFAVGDFNHDGVPDAAVPCGVLDVIIANGNGTYQPPVGYGSGAGTPAVTGDFNGDGNLDIAAGDTVFLGNGIGGFTSLPSFASYTVEGMTSGDFNNDGKTDLAMVVYPTSISLERLFFSNGDGTFTPSFLQSTPTTGLAVADLNGDGANDVFSITAGSTTTTTYTTLNVPVVALAPGRLNFPNGSVGITSSPLTLTVSNPAVAPLTLGTASVSGDFAISSNTCGASLASGTDCTIQVTFTPTALGTRTGLISLPSNSFGGTANLALTGNSVAAGPAVQLSPTSLLFAVQQVGSSSPTQVVVLTNSGSTADTFTSFSTTGDFSQKNICPASLNPSATCTISVTFTPTATGARSGSVIVTDNAGTQTVTLSGTGTAPAVKLSPTTLTFATQPVTTTSKAKIVTLTNTGTAPLTITSLSFTGANPTSYTETNTCGSTVAAGGSCSTSVQFKPATINTLTATLNVYDNSTGSPQTVSLSGVGTDIQLTPATINFGSVTVGTKSAVKKVTVNNLNNNSVVSITSIGFTGTNAADFTETTTCKSSIQPETSCSVSITFTPGAKGARSASLSIADNGGGSPQTAVLSGTGK